MFGLCRQLVFAAVVALSLASGAEACASTAACEGAATATTGSSYQIGFVNAFSNLNVCIYKCDTSGNGSLASRIVPPAVGDEQYWPWVGNGERYAAYIENGSKVGFASSNGEAGHEVVANGQAATQAGQSFTIATVGSRRRLLFTWHPVIYTQTSA